VAEGQAGRGADFYAAWQGAYERGLYELLLAHRAAYDNPSPFNAPTSPELKTTDIATKLGLPTNTVRRALEDLAAYGLARRTKGGSGNPDTWTAINLDD
jgi:hypothetical protein